MICIPFLLKLLLPYWVLVKSIGEIPFSWQPIPGPVRPLLVLRCRLTPVLRSEENPSVFLLPITQKLLKLQLQLADQKPFLPFFIPAGDRFTVNFFCRKLKIWVFQCCPDPLLSLSYLQCQLPWNGKNPGSPFDTSDSTDTRNPSIPWIPALFILRKHAQRSFLFSWDCFFLWN